MIHEQNTFFHPRCQQTWIYFSIFTTDKQQMMIYGIPTETCPCSHKRQTKFFLVRVKYTSDRLTEEQAKKWNVDETCFGVFWWKINEPKSSWYHELCTTFQTYGLKRMLFCITSANQQHFKPFELGALCICFYVELLSSFKYVL